MKMSVVFNEKGELQLVGEEQSNVNVTSLGTNKASLLLQYTELKSDEYYRSLASQRQSENIVLNEFLNLDSSFVQPFNHVL
jgi:hypothetical protein